MSRNETRLRMTRRDLLRLGGGMLGAAAAASGLSKILLPPTEIVRASSAPLRPARGGFPGDQPAPQQADRTYDKVLHFVGTDGWAYLPGTVEPYHPDEMAPDPFNVYMFGFADVTDVENDPTLSPEQKVNTIRGHKMKCQTAAPLFWLKEGTDNLLKLTNLGLQIRPDLIDSHTLHFHGFRNAIPIFDGEPHSSVGVPINRDLTYFYHPRDPGTYMYHCHFEETEHVHMGMTGPCFVTPLRNEGATRLGGNLDAEYMGYVYDDDSTAYHREYIMLLTEVWTVSHWSDSHIQLPEWSEYAPEFYLLNGRVWDDTILPNGEGHNPATHDLLPPNDPDTGEPIDRLQFQPVSSLVQCNAGEKVLFRIINLGFEHQSMRLQGIKMRVVGKDATLLRGRNGADLSYETNTVAIGPGESMDVIFTAPDTPGTYLFYNRDYTRLNNGGGTGKGGQMTEVRVFPEGTLDPQTEPNH